MILIIPDAPIQNFLPTGGMIQSGAAITGEKERYDDNES